MLRKGTLDERDSCRLRVLARRPRGGDGEAESGETGVHAKQCTWKEVTEISKRVMEVMEVWDHRTYTPIKNG